MRETITAPNPNTVLVLKRLAKTIIKLAAFPPP